MQFPKKLGGLRDLIALRIKEQKLIFDHAISKNEMKTTSIGGIGCMSFVTPERSKNDVKPPNTRGIGCMLHVSIRTPYTVHMKFTIQNLYMTHSLHDSLFKDTVSVQIIPIIYTKSIIKYELKILEPTVLVEELKYREVKEVSSRKDCFKEIDRIFKIVQKIVAIKQKK